MKELIINTTLISYPLIIYTIYIYYKKIREQSTKNVIYDLFLLLSIYLIYKYGLIEQKEKLIIYTTAPLMLLYLNKSYPLAIITSIILVLLISNIYVFYLLFFYLIIQVSTSKLTQRKRLNIYKITTIVLTFILSIMSNQNIKLSIFYSIIPTIIMTMSLISNKIIEDYNEIYNLKKEKEFKLSIFKITHEIKNPIAVCKGYIEIIKNNNYEIQESYINIINDELDRSLNIMNDFMELGKLKIDKDILDLNCLLDDVSSSVKILLKSKKIKYICNITEDEYYVLGDYNRLKQVIINIVKNSIESINDSGEISISISVTKKYYNIKIFDNGIGISKENLEKINDIFFTTKQNGTGLGIPLSREIIKLHNGKLIYKSELNKYTEVTIKLLRYMI